MSTLQRGVKTEGGGIRNERRVLDDGREQRGYRLRWYNRWYVYPLLVLVLDVPVVWLAGERERVFGFATYRTPSDSMTPTTVHGDFIVVDTRPPTVAALGVGDFVVCDRLSQPGEQVLRRIVAVGGRHVVVDAEGLHVDGQLQPRTRQQGSDMLDSRWMQFTDVQLGPDELYLMGDNRGNSIDSRTEGPYPRSSLRAKATAIWWAGDAPDRRVRTMTQRRNRGSIETLAAPMAVIRNPPRKIERPLPFSMTNRTCRFQAAVRTIQLNADMIRSRLPMRTRASCRAAASPRLSMDAAHPSSRRRPTDRLRTTSPLRRKRTHPCGAGALCIKCVA